MKNEAFEVVPGYAVKDRLGRVKINREARTALVGRFMVCGLTQAEFCRREEINPTTFSGWLTACRVDGSSTSDTGRSPSSATDTGPIARSPTKAHAPSAFRELRVETPVPTPGSMCISLTIILSGGVEVRGCDTKSAVDLIKALREVS